MFPTTIEESVLEQAESFYRVMWRPDWTPGPSTGSGLENEWMDGNGILFIHVDLGVQAG